MACWREVMASRWEAIGSRWEVMALRREAIDSRREAIGSTREVMASRGEAIGSRREAMTSHVIDWRLPAIFTNDNPCHGGKNFHSPATPPSAGRSVVDCRKDFFSRPFSPPSRPAGAFSALMNNISEWNEIILLILRYDSFHYYYHLARFVVTFAVSSMTCKSMPNRLARSSSCSKLKL